MPVLVGAPLPADLPVGFPLTNSVVLCSSAGVETVAHKRLIPTYDIFDEWRYFRPGPQEGVGVLEIQGLRLGITVCEDAWNDSSFWPHHRYTDDPVAELAARGIDGMINIAASPFLEALISSSICFDPLEVTASGNSAIFDFLDIVTFLTSRKILEF